MPPNRPWCRHALALGLAIGLAVGSAGLARAQDPRVPAGLDPGGIAVAVVGAGLDYTQVAISRRLARDGEGDLIGWDAADNDARPFATGAASDTALAALLLEAAPQSRLIAVRVAPRQQAQIAAGLRLLAETPARIVLIVADPGPPLALADVAAAARQLAHLVIVVPARRVAPAPAVPPGERGGLLVVGAAAGAGQGGPADVAFTADAGTHAAAAALHDEDIAAARVAALIAGLAAAAPEAPGPVLRERLLALAKPSPGGVPVINPSNARPGR